MEMNGEQRIPASREVVWAALNDPDILKACIPGCQELIKSSDTNMTAVAVIKVGPVSAKFQGAVTLSDLDPPNGYKITGEGQGGVAGFAKGSALVRLDEEAGETLLCYQVSADIGGKLAQLGGRLIDATARKMSDAFFKKFSEEIQNRAAGHDGAMPAAAVSSDGMKSSAAPRGSAPARQTPVIDRRSQSAPVNASHMDRLIQPLLVVILIGMIAFGALFVAGKSDLGSGAASVFSVELGAFALLLIVAATAYLLGRISTANAADVQLDSTSFRELLHAMRESDR